MLSLNLKTATSPPSLARPDPCDQLEHRVAGSRKLVPLVIPPVVRPFWALDPLLMAYGH